MTMTAKEMQELSLAARVKKYGGQKGFKRHMQEIARRPRKPRKKVIPSPPLEK